MLQAVTPIQEAIGTASGYKSGVWFEMWDLPSIVEQMRREDEQSDKKNLAEPVKKEFDVESFFSERQLPPVQPLVTLSSDGIFHLRSHYPGPPVFLQHIKSLCPLDSL